MGQTQSQQIIQLHIYAMPRQINVLSQKSVQQFSNWEGGVLELKSILNCINLNVLEGTEWQGV